MSKYNHLKFLKRTKARVNHQCNSCGVAILSGQFYYAEEIKDEFLHSLHRKKFCDSCYQKYGDKLLESRQGYSFQTKSQRKKQKSLF